MIIIDHPWLPITFPMLDGLDPLCWLVTAKHIAQQDPPGSAYLFESRVVLIFRVLLTVGTGAHRNDIAPWLAFAKSTRGLSMAGLNEEDTER